MQNVRSYVLCKITHPLRKCVRPYVRPYVPSKSETGECPMKKYKKCTYCGDVKKRVCAKNACKDSKELMYPSRKNAVSTIREKSP